MVFEFFRIKKKLPKDINTFCVILVPKNTHPTKFLEYKPISLMHGLYKIIGKLFSSRLHIVMTTLISPHQMPFISGR